MRFARESFFSDSLQPLPPSRHARDRALSKSSQAIFSGDSDPCDADCS
jgi:hypothetical protein